MLWKEAALISVRTNSNALFAQAAIASARDESEAAMVRLSSGKRINAAKDDAAGVAIIARQTSHIRGMAKSIRNSLDAQSLIHTAEGGLREITESLQRIRELAVQAASDICSADDRANLNVETQTLLMGIDSISSSTTWAGQSLLDGTFTDKSFQVGASDLAADQLMASIVGVSQSDLGLGPVEEIQGKQISVAQLGSEVQVNTSTHGFQTAPEIISLTNGNQVVMWQSAHEGNRYQIYAQLYDASGNAIGSEFNLSSDDNFFSWWVSSAALSDGSFIATWTTYQKDGSGYGIYGRRFASDGNHLGDEFLINTETDGSQQVSSIAALADGGFVVAWQSLQQDGSSLIYAQRFSSTGTKVGGEFQVNTYTEGSQISPSAFSLENGGFGITFEGGPGIVTQLYNSDGTLNSSQSQSSDSGRLSISGGFSSASLSSGGFVTTFAQDGSVYAQKHDAEGNKAGLVYQVNNDNGNSHYWPTITPINSEYYVVTWTSKDSDSNGVYGRVISGLTDTVSDVFLINTHETSNQQFAVAVETGDNEFSVTWSSNNQDGSGYGIFKQRFQLSENAVSTSPENTYVETIVYGEDGGQNPFKLDQSVATFNEDGLSLSTSRSASLAIIKIDAALDLINLQRAELGTLSNRLDHIVANNTNAFINSQASRSRIQDADFAVETAKLAGAQMLTQASTAMLAQANASVYDALILLPD